MRVVLLVTDHQPGGTPLRVARLARGLHARGIEVHAGCLASRGPVTDLLDAEGIPTFCCGAHSAAGVLALVRLSRHIRRIRPDIIHSHLMHANVAARLVGWLQRVPVIGSTATIEVERRWHLRLERLTAPLEHGHVVNSRALAEHVARSFGIVTERIHVVPPSLALSDEQVDREQARAALGVALHEFAVVWVGRIDPVKRLHIIKGVAELLADLPVRFLLVGGAGPRTSRRGLPSRVGEHQFSSLVERQFREGHAARNVTLLGWRDDIPAVLTAADAFLFPSLTEGMPNAVLEAMARGLAIVGSDIPVLRELGGLDDSPPEVGCRTLPRLITVAGDHAEPYADALRMLYEHPRERAELGARAAAWAQGHLRSEATVDATLAIYRSVLESRAAR
jgi:glycosyltransferase involved in cell wall biosynthesis